MTFRLISQRGFRSSTLARPLLIISEGLSPFIYLKNIKYTEFSYEASDK